MTDMDYNEAIEYIHSIPKFRRPLGNAQLAKLLECFGDPQDKLKIIHIAGTNGKGSAAAMLTEILKAQGYKTGMFTSPFIEVFNERIQINGVLISDEDIALYTHTVKKVMEEHEAYVSEFAFVTAIAFLYFYDKHCDYVVLETGMGGRLDATNIVKRPCLSVLMSIGLDHMQYLGDTIEEITKEKCGIIKHGRPVVSYPNDNVSPIIEAVAAENMSELVFADKAVEYESGFLYKGTKYSLGLKGAYQPQNAGVVIECVNMLKKYGVEISDDSVTRGLSQVKWPVRFEFVRDNVVIDGGHNIDGIRALKKSLQKDGRRIILVMAMMDDKNYSECVKEISQIADKLYASQLDMPRCAGADAIAAAAQCRCEIKSSPEEALKSAVRYAGDDGLVCVCGSLYLAGEIRKKFS